MKDLLNPLGLVYDRTVRDVDLQTKKAYTTPGT